MGSASSIHPEEYKQEEKEVKTVFTIFEDFKKEFYDSYKTATGYENQKQMYERYVEWGRKDVNQISNIEKQKQQLQ